MRTTRETEGRVRGVRITRSLRLVLLLMTFVLAAPAADALAGQIVWRKAGSSTIDQFWVMNDDGSGAHKLFDLTQIGLHGANDMRDPALVPGGSVFTFEATTGDYHDNQGPPGACGLNCTGVYVYDGGQIRRLTAAAQHCGISQFCTSFETEGRPSTDGRVFANYAVYSYETSCSSGTCGYAIQGSSIKEYVRSLAGGDETEVPTPGCDLSSLAGPSHVDLAPDPVDPSHFTYAGCKGTAGAGSGQWPIVLGDSSGSVTGISYDDQSEFDPSWSPDGTHVLDVEGGDTPGIWTYDTSPATTPGKAFTELLADPGSNAAYPDIMHARFIGGDRVVFSAQGNLWTIPASCTAATCTFPASATQLTHDDGSATQDLDPTWTSAARVEPVDTPPPSGSGGQPGPGDGTPGTAGQADPVTALVAAGHGRGRARSGLRFTITLARKATVTAKITRLRRHRYRTFGSVRLNGHAGVNKFTIHRAGGHEVGAGRYRVRVSTSGGGKARTLSFNLR